MDTILLMDNDEQSLECHRNMLINAGHAVVIARDGHSALAALMQNDAIDMIVTEIMIPDMDKTEYFRALNRTAYGKPVIVVSTDCSVEDYLHAVHLGVVEYLNKPVLKKELCRIVRIALAPETAETKGLHLS